MPPPGTGELGHDGFATIIPVGHETLGGTSVVTHFPPRSEHVALPPPAPLVPLLLPAMEPLAKKTQ